MPGIYDDPHIPIMVKLRESFTISLKSNPSTGYSWTAEYDSSAIELPHEKKFMRQSNFIGAGGAELFTFCTKKKGKTTVKMKYQRPWEKMPVETKEFNIQIDEH
jgi:inhibitor of cysteine peptidase